MTFNAGEWSKNHQQAQREEAKPENPVNGFAHRFENMKED